MSAFCRCAFLVILLFTSLTDAEACAKNSYRALLSAFAEKRSYYTINENTDLLGNTIELPEETIIEFKGGSFSNGKIICNNNTLIGYSGLADNLDISGTVIGPLDLSVFVLRRNDKGFDLGRVLNQANKLCNSFIVPEGVFYIQTPAVIESIKFYEQKGDIIYNGSSKDLSVLSFINAYTAVINLNGKVAYDIDSDIINYTKKNRTNIIGVEFRNVNNSRVYVADVEYFNNNIRISAQGAGNCYNLYVLNLSVFSNEHLRIIQKDDSSNQIGWCNENIFIGGRFCNWSHFDWSRCESVAIKIEGSNESDSYNSANSLLFIKPCIEEIKGYAVYAKNVTGCHWQDARTENSEGFIKFVGDCRYNEANSLYGTTKIDYQECATYPLVMKDMLPLLTLESSINKTIELDTRDAKLFKVVFSNPDAKARVSVQYLTEENGHCIKRQSQNRYTRPRSTTYPYSYYYNQDASQWKLGADSSETDFVIPDEVTKINIILSGSNNGATIYSNKQTKVTEK